MRNIYPQKSQNQGFTIVELIVIIVVIGILAAITIVSYNAITENSRKEQVATNARTLNAALGKYKSEKGSYPDGSQVGAVIQSAGLKESDVQYDYNASSGSFCFTVSGNGTSANISSGNSLVKEGGCAGHGINGAAPITNLFTNPSAELNSTGWAIALTGVTLTADTTEKHSGARSMRVVTPGTAVGEGAIVTVTPGGMPGNRYSGGIWVKAPAGALLYMTTRTSGAAAQDNPQVAITGNGVWQFVKSENKLAQSDATVLQVHVRTRSSAQAITFYVDDAIVVRETTLGGYADGTTPGWIWTGTPNASTSRGPAQ